MVEREARKSGGSREVRQRIESISLMEVAARTALCNKWTDEEKNALPRRGDESWIGLYQEFLKLFHLPLQFDKLAGGNIYYGHNKQSVVCRKLQAGQGGFHSAICTNIMRAGRHTVSFNVDNRPTGGAGITLGIMRPTREDITRLNYCYPAYEDLSRFALKDYENLHRADNIDCCLLSTAGGISFTKRWSNQRTDINNWEGQEEIRNDTSFKIGMVLDLDEGTLDVYKNDRRLGTTMTGLVGEYCWVVSLRPEQNPDASKTISIDR